MLSLLALLGFVGFLLVATPVVRRGRAFSPARVALVPFGLLCHTSLILASPRFGNRLAATEGYWPMAGPIFLKLALTIGTPLELSAAAVRATMRAGCNWMLVIAAGVVAAICGWFLGIFTMFAIVWS